MKSIATHIEREWDEYKVSHEVYDQDFDHNEEVVVYGGGKCKIIIATYGNDYEMFVQARGMPRFNVKHIEQGEDVALTFDGYILNNEAFLNC